MVKKSRQRAWGSAGAGLLLTIIGSSCGGQVVEEPPPQARVVVVQAPPRPHKVRVQRTVEVVAEPQPSGSSNVTSHQVPVVQAAPQAAPAGVCFGPTGQVACPPPAAAAATPSGSSGGQPAPKLGLGGLNGQGYKPSSASSGPPTAAAQQQTPAQQAAEDPRTVQEARQYVLDHLKSPGSAQFVSHALWHCPRGNVLVHVVDSQNGFGALIRSTWITKVPRGGHAYDGVGCTDDMCGNVALHLANKELGGGCTVVE